MEEEEEPVAVEVVPVVVPPKVQYGSVKAKTLIFFNVDASASRRVPPRTPRTQREERNA